MTAMTTHPDRELIAVERGAPPGDLAVWFFICAELLAFGIFFLGFAMARRFNREMFDAGQATLDTTAGLLNTLLLITSSLLVAKAVQALRQGASRVAVRRLLGGFALGAAFLLVKGYEYSVQFAAGMSFDDTTFSMFYIGLTGFHAMHVVLGMLVLVIVAWQTAVGYYTPSECNGAESGAAYWHMVDLVWLILFPLVYVIH
ncbi:MAG: cytochrome c oxidase subunit 3 [Candidatus Competibacterales bacterium]|nr:cytochrome c oxidase subunit 3 [Candidatus Competibacterales bacterium]